MQGMSDFILTDTEQYYCHVDPANQVLYTTTVHGKHGKSEFYAAGTVMCPMHGLHRTAVDAFLSSPRDTRKRTSTSLKPEKSCSAACYEPPTKRRSYNSAHRRSDYCKKQRYPATHRFEAGVITNSRNLNLQRGDGHRSGSIPYQSCNDSSNIPVSSSCVNGRGASLLTRSWGIVPLTRPAISECP